MQSRLEKYIWNFYSFLPSCFGFAHNTYCKELLKSQIDLLMEFTGEKHGCSSLKGEISCFRTDYQK